MVAVRSFDNYIYANILLSRLKEAGIDCYLKDENTITIDPLLSPAIGGMKLMVKPTDLARVNVLLDQYENEFLGTLSCPNCKKNTIQRLVKKTQPSNPITSFFNRLIHGSPIQEKIIYRCSYCGFTVDDISQIQPDNEELRHL